MTTMPGSTAHCQWLEDDTSYGRSARIAVFYIGLLPR
jgi:hypothetical protein